MHRVLWSRLSRFLLMNPLQGLELFVHTVTVHTTVTVNNTFFIVNCCHCTERPKAKVTIKPDQHVFRGDTVTLRCDIDGEGVTNWRYSWYKDDSVSVFSELQEHTFRSAAVSDAGKYACYGVESGGSRSSQHSDSVTLTVSGEFDHILLYTFNILLSSDLSIPFQVFLRRSGWLKETQWLWSVRLTGHLQAGHSAGTLYWFHLVRLNVIHLLICFILNVKNMI